MSIGGAATTIFEEGNTIMQHKWSSLLFDAPSRNETKLDRRIETDLRNISGPLVSKETEYSWNKTTNGKIIGSVNRMNVIYSIFLDVTSESH